MPPGFELCPLRLQAFRKREVHDGGAMVGVSAERMLLHGVSPVTCSTSHQGSTLRLPPWSRRRVQAVELPDREAFLRLQSDRARLLGQPCSAPASGSVPVRAPSPSAAKGHGKARASSNIGSADPAACPP